MCGWVSFFVVVGNSVVAGKSSQNENTFWFPISSFYEKILCVTLLWSDSLCVYFVRPNTLLLFIFLFCIFLLYRTDPQVEVQIRILLRINMWNRVKMQTPAITSWFPEQLDFPNTDSKKISTWVSLLTRNNLLANLCFL